MPCLGPRAGLVVDLLVGEAGHSWTSAVFLRAAGREATSTFPLLNGRQPRAHKRCCLVHVAQPEAKRPEAPERGLAKDELQVLVETRRDLVELLVVEARRGPCLSGHGMS